MLWDQRAEAGEEVHGSDCKNTDESKNISLQVDHTEPKVPNQRTKAEKEQAWNGMEESLKVLDNPVFEGLTVPAMSRN